VAVLELPVVLFIRAESPAAVLPLPSYSTEEQKPPMAVLEPPSVLFIREYAPTAVFAAPDTGFPKSIEKGGVFQQC